MLNFKSHSDLEAAPVSRVAEQLLKHLLKQSGADHARPFNFGNVVGEVGTLYGHRWECKRAASEALSWLIARQFIAPDTEQAGRGWYLVSRLGVEAGSQTDLQTWISERELPEDHLQPAIAAEALDVFRQGKFDTAVFIAFRTLEVRIREAAKLGNEAIGTKLAARAFHPEDGPLTDLSAEAGERQALMQLMSGAIGLFKNPTSHREVQLSGTEAREMLVIASHLMRIVTQRSSSA